MPMVLAPIDELPSLRPSLAARRALGLDRYDEWWEGVYHVITGPSPAEQAYLVLVGVFVLSMADAAALVAVAPVAIGDDGRDTRVPDICVYRPDTAGRSEALLPTAELVVEVLSPGEQPGAKLDFYARWGVREHLEIDPVAATARLLRRADNRWEEVSASEVLGFAVEPGALASIFGRFLLRPMTRTHRDGHDCHVDRFRRARLARPVHGRGARARRRDGRLGLPAAPGD